MNAGQGERVRAALADLARAVAADRNALVAEVERLTRECEQLRAVITEATKGSES